ncbi:MAG: hypothetical protein R6U45_02290 [Thioalkalivibrio sp.]
MSLLAGCATSASAPDDRTAPEGWDPAPTAFEARAVPSLEPMVVPGAAVMEWLAASRWASGLAIDYAGLEIDQPRPEHAEVRLTGLRDDAVSAYEFRLGLDETEAGWVVRSVERRAICRRGLGDSGLCL